VHQPRERILRVWRQRQRQMYVVAHQHVGVQSAPETPQPTMQALQRWRSGSSGKQGRRLFPRCTTCWGMPGRSKRGSRAMRGMHPTPPASGHQRRPDDRLVPNPSSEIVPDTFSDTHGGSLS
jgi:hypothetical protein